MNALSQYNEIAFFPRLLNEKERIEKLILDFFYNTVLPMLPDSFQDFIIDFALTGDFQSPRLWVIEVISSSFSWTYDVDHIPTAKSILGHNQCHFVQLEV